LAVRSLRSRTTLRFAVSVERFDRQKATAMMYDTLNVNYA